MIVLGIDPGLASTGYGVVARRDGRLVALDGGVIATGAELARERRLADIHARLCELLQAHRPDAMALEELYFGQNVRTAFAVGQARGVAMLAAGQRGIPCACYTPQQVKGAVCGSGRAARTGRADGRGAAGPRRCAALRSRRRRARGRDLPRQPRAAVERARRGGRMIALLRGEVAERRADHVVVLCGGVGYRVAVSARDAAPCAPGRRGGDAARAPDRARRRAHAVRLSLRAGARPVPDAAVRPGGRPEGRARGPLRGAAARADRGDRGRRRGALPGRAGGRQAHRRADHRRAAREGRRRRRRRRSRRPDRRARTRGARAARAGARRAARARLRARRGRRAAWRAPRATAPRS